MLKFSVHNFPKPSCLHRAHAVQSVFLNLYFGSVMVDNQGNLELGDDTIHIAAVCVPAGEVSTKVQIYGDPWVIDFIAALDTWCEAKERGSSC